MSNEMVQQVSVDDAASGQRLDVAAARLFPVYSRAQLAKFVQKGRLTLNGVVAQKRAIVQYGDVLVLDAGVSDTTITAGAAPRKSLEPHVVYQDDDLLVIDKPRGLVVHHGTGRTSGTLLDWLMENDSAARILPRAGIVHRLDKDTTGLMVIARSQVAHQHFSKLFAQHEIDRQYVALCVGRMPDSLVIDLPLMRDPIHPTKRMVARGEDVANARRAKTIVTPQESYPLATLVTAHLLTGRTHQVRVHLAAKKHPLVGDVTYGYRSPDRSAVQAHYGDAWEDVWSAYTHIQTPMLHAKHLAFAHPTDQREMSFDVELPQRFAEAKRELARVKTDG